MGCSAGTRTLDFIAPPPPRVIVGVTGLILLCYTGYYDLVQYQGSFTGKIYHFGLEKSEGYVDKRDADDLLKKTEDGKSVFVEGAEQ